MPAYLVISFAIGTLLDVPGDMSAAADSTSLPVVGEIAVGGRSWVVSDQGPAFVCLAKVNVLERREG